MRAVTTLIVLLIPLAGCDSRPSSQPIEASTNAEQQRVLAKRGLPSESRPRPSPLTALQAARDLAGGDPWIALAAYDDAIAKIDAHLVELGEDEAAQDVRSSYREALIESDQLVEKVETPSYEAKVPVRDMLSNEERSLWQSSPGVKHSLRGRELTIEGIRVEGATDTGVCSFGSEAAPPWHDVVIEVEFTIHSGGFELYLRCQAGKLPYAVWLSPGHPAPESSPSAIGSYYVHYKYELMRSHRVTVSLKGSAVELLQPDRAKLKDILSVDMSRAGGIGFALERGSKVVITSCKLKVLR